MLIDSQIHLWAADRKDRPWPRQGEGGRTATPHRDTPLDAAEALAAMDQAKVDRAILVPPSWEGDRNDVALAAAHAHPDRFAVMGRIGEAPDCAPELGPLKDTPGFLGLRVILSPGSLWRTQGAQHWLWRAASDADLPVMIAPASAPSIIADIVRAYPNLRIIIDHMGARVHHTGQAAFADIDAILALAEAPNVAVKASCLPGYSAMQEPWPDALPYLRQLFDAYGPGRLFWGSDLSRLPCDYGALVEFFMHKIDWLSGEARDLVMGRAIQDWLDWN